MTTDTKKQAIIAALRAFIEQRPGFETCNYATVSDYRSDQRRAQRQLHDARELLRAVELRGSITADAILAECGGGRLQLREITGTSPLAGKVWVDYCTGQYFPTEFRGAVARLLASVLWTWTREQCMPAPTYRQHGSADNLPMTTEALYSGKSAGDWLRNHFKREFGRSLAARYFN